MSRKYVCREVSTLDGRRLPGKAKLVGIGIVVKNGKRLMYAPYRGNARPLSSRLDEACREANKDGDQLWSQIENGSFDSKVKITAEIEAEAQNKDELKILLREKGFPIA